MDDEILSMLLDSREIRAWMGFNTLIFVMLLYISYRVSR